MEQTSQDRDATSTAAGLGLVAPEEAPYLLPRPAELLPATTATANTKAVTAADTAGTSTSDSSNSRPASPSAGLEPGPGPPLLTPGRVRTNSGTTCSAQEGTAEDCDYDCDDECLLDEHNSKNFKTAADSPTCIADTSLIDASLIDDGEVEVSLVEVEPSTSIIDYDYSYHDYGGNEDDNKDESSMDAPATPRAAQLLLEDLGTTPVGLHNSSSASGGANAVLATTPSNDTKDNDLASFLFCGVQHCTGAPSPVKLPDLHNNKSEATSAAAAAQKLQQDTATTTADTNETERQTSSETQQQPPPEAAQPPSSPIASQLSCAPCKASKASTGDDQKLHEQTAIEATIGNFLSSPGEWCDGWQAWSLHMAAVCDRSAAGNGHANANANLTARDQTELKTVLRNRAGDLSARRKRIHRLRRDLSPFDTVHTGGDGDDCAPVGAGAGPAGSGTFTGIGPAGRHFRSVSTTGHSLAGSATGGPSSNNGASGVLTGREGMATPPPVPGRTVKKSRSFTDAAIVLTRSTTTNNAADDASSVVSITSSIVDAISNCDVDSVSGSGVGKGRKGSKRSSGSGKGKAGHRRSSDPMRTSLTSGSDADGAADEDLCYDSDPEHANGNCRDLRRQSLHRPKPRLPPSEKTNESVGRFLSQGGTWSADEANDQAQSSSSSPAEIDPRNDDHIAKAVDGILHRRMMLVWHQPEGPVAVYAWIELGSQLRSALIQPKLMWKPVHETEDERGALGITNHINLHSVDLLDISRILASTKVDRKKHPLAKSKCSLSIETFDHNLLFEASCQEERDALVQGLKGLVARLASKIIVGDERVFDEYFTPFGASVPGEAPEWARS